MIWEDLRFFLLRLKELSVSESLEVDGGFCVSTGNEFENWVYYPERVRDVETVKKVMEFFAERNESFMWPVYDGGNEVIERAGLLHAGHLEAMSLDPEKAITDWVNKSVIIKPVNSPELCERWLNCEWRGFGIGEGEPSEAYCALTKAFFNDRENLSMYVAELEGEDAGAFMTTNEASLTGVYYFATVPEMRRKGVAASMMNEVCRLSKGKRIVLQATPAGVPFYESFGFEDLGEIEIYSTTADIF